MQKGRHLPEQADKNDLEKRKPEVVITDITLSFPNYSKKSLQNYLLKLIVYYSILNGNSVSANKEKIKDRKGSFLYCYRKSNRKLNEFLETH